MSQKKRDFFFPPRKLARKHCGPRKERNIYTRNATERTFWRFSNPEWLISSPEFKGVLSFFTLILTALLLRPYKHSAKEASEDTIEV